MADDEEYRALDIGYTQVVVHVGAAADRECPYHHRILLRRVSGAFWVCLAPNLERFVMDLDQEEYSLICRNALFPDHTLEAGLLYHDPISPVELRQHARAAREEAHLQGGDGEAADQIVYGPQTHFNAQDLSRASAPMSLTQLSASVALCLSAGLWLWPAQPVIQREVFVPSAPPAPPSSFDCRCECPAPAPGGSASSLCEAASCPWSTTIFTFLAGCLFTASLLAALWCCCRPGRASTAVQVYALEAPQPQLQPQPRRLAPKALTPSQRRLALGNV